MKFHSTNKQRRTEKKTITIKFTGIVTMRYDVVMLMSKTMKYSFHTFARALIIFVLLLKLMLISRAILVAVAVVVGVDVVVLLYFFLLLWFFKRALQIKLYLSAIFVVWPDFIHEIFICRYIFFSPSLLLPYRKKMELTFLQLF